MKGHTALIHPYIMPIHYNTLDSGEELDVNKGQHKLKDWQLRFHVIVYVIIIKLSNNISISKVLGKDFRRIKMPHPV